MDCSVFPSAGTRHRWPVHRHAAATARTPRVPLQEKICLKFKVGDSTTLPESTSAQSRGQTASWWANFETTDPTYTLQTLGELPEALETVLGDP